MCGGVLIGWTRDIDLWVQPRAFDFCRPRTSGAFPIILKSGEISTGEKARDLAGATRGSEVHDYSSSGFCLVPFAKAASELRTDGLVVWGDGNHAILPFEDGFVAFRAKPDRPDDHYGERE